MDKTVTDCAI